MPDCSPVSQWPPVSALAPWETAGKKVEEGGQRCVRRKIWRTTLECTRISNVPKQPQPPAFLPVLLIIRDECHTISRICHIYMEEMMTQSAFRFHLGCLQKCCWSCPVSCWAASEWAGQAHSTIAKQKVTNARGDGTEAWIGHKNQLSWSMCDDCTLRCTNSLCVSLKTLGKQDNVDFYALLSMPQTFNCFQLTRY